MKLIDLCCGMGGLAHGFQLAGHEIVAAYDHDPEAVQTYNRNVGDHAHAADLTELHGGGLPRCDGIIGGPPCQPFSSGSRNYKTHAQKGPTDTRNMIGEFVRLVLEARPRYFLMENVVGLLAYPDFIAELSARLLSAGYVPSLIILNAAYYGVPQDRRRVFICGWRSGSFALWPAPTHTRRSAITTRQALAHLFTPDTARAAPPYVRRSITLPGDVLVDTRNRSMRADRSRYYHARSLDRPAYTVTAGERRGSKLAVIGERAWSLGIEHNLILQNIPPNWQLPKDRETAARLVGNAVPPLMAYHLAKCVQP